MGLHSIFNSPWNGAIALVFLTVGLSGCASMQYLWQAGMGQLELANRSIPVGEAIHQPSLSPRVRKLLSQVEEIKKFGEAQQLKKTSNYRDYVSLERPYVVYVVSASQELKFESKYWRFPWVGSFPYLGWFSESDAHQYANELRLQGWDVDVRGARAYSTLGWFNDPLLSSMIHKGASGLGYLAEVVLHESVHSTFYIENQSTFNENLADFVGEKLATQYLEEKIGKNSDEYQAWIRSQRRSEEWGKILFGAYHELDKVYSSDFSEQEKKEKKRMTLEQVRTQIQDHREVNNATLMQYRTYQAGVPELEKLWEKSEKKWSVFWGKISEINSNSFKRQQEEDLSSVIRPLLD